jgi:hypothetical protein
MKMKMKMVLLMGEYELKMKMVLLMGEYGQTKSKSVQVVEVEEWGEREADSDPGTGLFFVEYGWS